jgi:hypothetical protein
LLIEFGFHYFLHLKEKMKIQIVLATTPETIRAEKKYCKSRYFLGSVCLIIQKYEYISKFLKRYNLSLDILIGYFTKLIVAGLHSAKMSSMLVRNGRKL